MHGEVWIEFLHRIFRPKLSSVFQNISQTLVCLEFFQNIRDPTLSLSLLQKTMHTVTTTTNAPPLKIFDFKILWVLDTRKMLEEWTTPRPQSPVTYWQVVLPGLYCTPIGYRLVAIVGSFVEATNHEIISLFITWTEFQSISSELQNEFDTSSTTPCPPPPPPKVITEKPYLQNRVRWWNTIIIRNIVKRIAVSPSMDTDMSGYYRPRMK